MPNQQTTTLTIRNVPSASRERLRVRAASHGHSMEAELRAILNSVLEDDTNREVNLAEAIRRRFAPVGGVELADHPEELVGDPVNFTA